MALVDYTCSVKYVFVFFLGGFFPKVIAIIVGINPFQIKYYS